MYIVYIYIKYERESLLASPMTTRCLSKVFLSERFLAEIHTMRKKNKTKMLTTASNVFDRKSGRKEKYITAQNTVYTRLYERAQANIAVKRYRINGKPLLTG